MVSLIMILEKDCCVWRQAPVIVKVKVWRKAFCILFFNSWGKVKVWPKLLNKLVHIHQFSLSTGHGSTGRTNYESTPELHLLDFSPLCIFKCLLKWLAQGDLKSHWWHLFTYSPQCIFKCFLKLPAHEDAQLHWLHFVDFSLLCVFKWSIKVLALEEAKSHWLHLFDFYPLCAFKCVLKLTFREEAKSHW